MKFAGKFNGGVMLVAAIVAGMGGGAFAVSAASHGQASAPAPIVELHQSAVEAVPATEEPTVTPSPEPTPPPTPTAPAPAPVVTAPQDTTVTRAEAAATRSESAATRSESSATRAETAAEKVTPAPKPAPAPVSPKATDPGPPDTSTAPRIDCGPREEIYTDNDGRKACRPKPQVIVPAVAETPTPPTAAE